MVNESGLPESVGVYNSKSKRFSYMPINEAIEFYQSTGKGKQYAFDANDTPEDKKKKLSATVNALSEMHKNVELHFDTIGKKAK